MALRIGDKAPIQAETTQGRIKFHEWLGDSYGILFRTEGFHPCLHH